MRYRSFGKSGQVVSAVSVLLDGRTRRSAKEWRNLVRLSLDCGINGFEIAGDSPSVLEGAAGFAVARIIVPAAGKAL